MKHFTEMPYGYRWMTEVELEEYHALDDDEPRWGWMRDEYIGLIPGSGMIVQWDCMIEFGLDHEHDATECERTMAMMSDPLGDYDDRDYSGWYGGERGYNDGLRWSDFV